LNLALQNIRIFQHIRTVPTCKVLARLGFWPPAGRVSAKGAWRFQ
jgi:hypothetical protein